MKEAGEAVSPSKSAKPPEDRTGKADKSPNWRKKKITVEMDDGDGLPLKSKERGLKVVDVEEQPEAKDGPGPSLPFKGIIPVQTGPNVAQDKLKKLEKYKLRAPVQNQDTIKAIIGKFNSAKIEDLTIGELLAASDEVREAVNTATGKKRVPFQQVNLSQRSEDPLPVTELDEPAFLRSDAILVDELPPVSAFLVQEFDDSLPLGSCVIPDPVEQYIASLPEGTTAKQIFVGPSSAALRVVFSVINTQGEVECIIDNGSQIVSMSLAAAEKAKLRWDPSVTIFMESANATLAQSLGLARNVPFTFGEITIYLQVHILRKPAYDVLLGRPFDIITESIVRNSADGGQVITLKDPNSGKRCSMSTYPRIRKPRKEAEPVPESHPPESTKPVEDEGFQDSSMN
ncbi:hypothetical protein FB45DRAFT_1038399 [Roridomyces roridus]|uniref:Aspartic peptidase DDI1-type domain-containing protein n=1 Tax=Roridomyces roridus TaxID=1738132 RepID=A0AAD7B4M1_9AGAR|nr:hypothetical protein FB45DRAFT_1038399 [Roridomyces roridus]